MDNIVDNGTIKISVSTGEIFDKITILEIKKSKIKDKQKLTNILKELNEISFVANRHISTEPIQSHIKELKKINMQLWQIEDDIRLKEKNKEFDNEFINLARSVYKINDKRAEVKKAINFHTNSYLTEEKSYSSY